MIKKTIRRLLCSLGFHGPNWSGYGLGVSSPSNYSVGPGHRACKHCGAQWFAYEASTNLPVRVIEWEQVKKGQPWQ